jgi:hypothetical protein
MKKRFIYTALSLTVLLCGTGVAFFINQRTFFRGFAGDILIVIFIYSSVKVILKDRSPFQIAAGVFSFALFVEFIQYTGIPMRFNPGSMITVLTLGSTYDPLDILAYAIGIVVIYVIDKLLIHPLGN